MELSRQVDDYVAMKYANFYKRRLHGSWDKSEKLHFPVNKFSQLKMSLDDAKLPSHLTACNTEVDTKKVSLISYFYLFDSPRLFIAIYLQYDSLS